MIANRKEFLIGLGMMIVFTGVLVGMFLPLFDGGRNGLNEMDALYNSISKASADYIPQLTEESKRYAGVPFDATLNLDGEEQADRAGEILKEAGALVMPDGNRLDVDGDLGEILAACLGDAASMFANQGEKLEQAYGSGARQVLFTWWKILQAMERQLNKQKRFAEAKFVSSVSKRGVECSYNYFGVEPRKISTEVWTVVFSLAFYVIYTVWYGFGFLYLFQGLGFRLEH